jgi:benzylsuccinate CoA-transferase BbsF subunit
MSGTPGEVRRPAPMLGQHNDYVFRELLGRSESEMTLLIEEKVIF